MRPGVRPEHEVDWHPPSRTATVAVVVTCLVLGMISALESRHIAATHGEPIHWALMITSTTPRWIFLAAVLPFVLRLATRFPPMPVRRRVVAIHGVAFIVVSLAQALVDAWALGREAPFTIMAFSLTARALRAWYSTLPTMVFMYAAALLAAWGMAEARERQKRTLRESQLEAQLHLARLASLRAKLQPHFLYNTLNGISALVAGERPARAVAAIEQLAELLQASLRDDERQVITVAEEMALTERYLALQRMRFPERLSYELMMDPGVADCLVPVLVLQPIVENAVVHGLDAGDEPLRIRVAANPAGESIELTVENDGNAIEPAGSPPAGHGVGLAATRARLITAYGDLASLSIRPRDGGGALVRLVIPRRSAAVVEPATAAAAATAGAQSMVAAR